MLNYAGLYSQMASFESNAGIFFIIIAVGIVCARILSARFLNKGKIVLLVNTGGVVLIASFFLLAVCNNVVMLYAIAFLLGIGFGYINPAFQTMLINLAEHNQRGTANATYFTFWDLGIGLGTAVGGIIIDKLNFGWLYAICAGALVLGVIYFATVSAAYFEKNKLR